MTKGRCVAAAAMAAGAIAVVPNLPFLRSFAIAGDDFGVILHSARFFEPKATEWFTLGFAPYFVHYPELGATGTRFLRPLVNLTIYAESWLAGSPESRLFLLTNYLGHAVCVMLVLEVGRRIAGLSMIAALLAAVVFAGSLSTQNLFYSAAFRGDMLGALFATSALLLIHVLRGRRLGAGLLLAIPALLLMALFSKETVISAPLVVVLYCFAMRRHSHLPFQPQQEGGRSRTFDERWLIGATLLAPLALYLGWRA